MASTALVNVKQLTKNGIRYHETKCEWKLQNLSSLPKVLRTKGMRVSRECYKRTMFSVEVRITSSTLKDNCINVQVRLERRDHQDFNLDTQLLFALDNEIQNPVFESSFDSKIPANFKVDEPCMWTSMSMEVDQPDWFSFSRDTVIVRVIVVASGCCLVFNNVNPLYSNYHLNNLIGDLRRSYVDKIHPDVEIAWGSHVLHAHKFLLCARSPVFRRELEDKTEAMIQYESSNRDHALSNNALSMFMYYLYTDYFVVPQDRATLEQVYRFATNYEVPSLQQMCGQVMVSYINLGTVCSIMTRAFSSQDVTLKKICMEFIRDNFERIRNTQPWISLKQNKPLLHSEVLVSFTGTQLPSSVKEEFLNRCLLS